MCAESQFKASHRITALDLAWLAFRNRPGMILSLSADDSSERTNSLISVGAVIGFPIDLFEAERKWQQRLDVDGIAYFKASECDNLIGEFEPAKRKWTPNAARTIADSVRRDLNSAFRSAPGIVGLGISLLLADFREAIDESPRALNYYGSDKTVALYIILLNTVVLLLDKHRPDCKGFPIACEFDLHLKFREAEQAYERLKKYDPLHAERLGHIGHGDDKLIPTLQMADMLASESRIKTQQWMATGNLKEVFDQNSGARTIFYLGIVRKEDLLNFRTF